MAEILVYQHGGSGNHGCEALLRTSVSMLEKFGNVTVSSFRPQEDKKYLNDRNDIKIIPSQTL